MFEQMRIEMKRYIKSRFAFFSFLLLALLFLASLFSGLEKANTQQLTMLGAIQETTSQVEAKENQLSKDKKTEEANREKERLTYLEPLVSEYSSIGDAQTRNELNLAYANFNLQEFAAGRQKDIQLIPYPNKEQEITQASLQQDVLYYQYLVDHKLTEVPDSQNQPAVNYLSNQLIYRISSILLFAFLAIQAAHFFTLDKRQGSIRFLNVLPISKHKLVMSKVWTFFLLNTGLFIVVAVIALVVVTLLNGFGHLSTPIVQSMVGETDVATMGEFLLAYSGLFIAGVFFLSMFSAFISLFTRHFISHIAWMFALLVVVQLGWLQASNAHEWFYYLPFHYLDISTMLFGETSMFMHPIGLGAVILIDWAVVFYVCILLTFGFRKRL